MSVFGQHGSCAVKAGSTMAKGTHSVVFKNRLAANTTLPIPIPEATSVAVKEFPLPSCSQSADAHDVQHQILGSFIEELTENVINVVPPHPNVCRLYGVEVVDGKVNGGGLDRVSLTMGWVEKMERPKTVAAMPEPEAQRLARDLVAAIAHLHGSTVSHDDIRPHNVLLTRLTEAEKTDHSDSGRTFRAIVTDYAIIRKIQSLLDPESGNATTKQKPNYCAPEVFTAGGDYDPFKVDVWAIGATVLEFLSGKLPFHELDPTGRGNIMFKIIQGRAPPQYPAGISDDAQSFLNVCFERDFNSRASVEELLEHPFVKQA